MLRYWIGFCALALAGSGFCASDSIWSEARKFTKPPFRWRNVSMIRPASTHLRYENISDEEVREIQRTLKPVVGDVLLNIGGVSTGCNCEEGPECTEQVWVVANNARGTQGFTLSRINRHWGLGVLPLWIVENQRLQREFANTTDDAKRRALAEAWVAHQNSLPLCHSLASASGHTDQR